MASLYITKTSHEITTLCFSKATKMHGKKIWLLKTIFLKKSCQRKHSLPFSSQNRKSCLFPKTKGFSYKKNFQVCKRGSDTTVGVL